MAAEGSQINPEGLPPDDSELTLPQSRRLYVTRALCGAGILLDEIEDPRDDGFLGSELFTLPGLWGSENIYCQAFNKFVLTGGDDQELDPADLVRLEDQARLNEYRICTRRTGAGIREIKLRRAARCIKTPAISSSLPDCLILDGLKHRNPRVLQAERRVLETDITT